MSKRTPAESFPPGDYIREEMQARGWSQVDLADAMGCPLWLVSEIIRARRAITPGTASMLGRAFGVDPQFFLNLESAYQSARRELMEDNA